MEKNNYTDIDKLFQSRLADEGNERIPSNELFKRAMEKVKPEKKQKRRPVLFWLLGLMIIMTSIVSLINYYHIKSVKQDIENLKLAQQNRLDAHPESSIPLDRLEQSYKSDESSAVVISDKVLVACCTFPEQLAIRMYNNRLDIETSPGSNVFAQNVVNGAWQ